MSRKLYNYKQLILLRIIVFSLIPMQVNADVDFMVFPEVRIDHDEGANFSERNVKPSLDLFVSRESGAFLFLAEAYLSESEQHFERLQLGLTIGNSARGWVGRYHNPFGYWNTQYHHGNFLQTSISRPAMVEFGADGGIMPSHYTGLLYEGIHEQGESAWSYAFAAGLASQMQASGGGHHGGNSPILHDFDLFNPKTNHHELGYTLRLAYLPDALGEDQVGGFITHATLTNEQTPNDDITLDAIGFFANHRRDQLRLLGEIYHFSTKVPDNSQTLDGSFSTVYVQAEYSVTPDVTPYLRLANTYGRDNDPYLDLLEGYAHQSETVGLRWDVGANQSLKIEYSHRHIEHETGGRWLISWSAVWL